MNNICHSPTESGKRCSNTRVGASYHCEHHANLLKPIYLQYKHILINDWVNLTEDDLHQYTIEKLLLVLARIEKVYDLRVRHRAKAFVPELWHKGHDTYIELCIRQLFRLRNVLRDKFTATEKQVEEYNSDEDEPEQVEISEELSYDRIVSVCKRVVETEADWQSTEAIDAYKLTQKKISICSSVMASMIRRLIPIEDDDMLHALTRVFLINGARFVGVLITKRLVSWFHMPIGSKATVGRSSLTDDAILETHIDTIVDLIAMCKLPSAISNLILLCTDTNNEFKRVTHFRIEMKLDKAGSTYAAVKGLQNNGDYVRIHLYKPTGRLVVKFVDKSE